MKKDIYISMALAIGVIFIGDFYMAHGGKYLGAVLVVFIVVGVFYSYMGAYRILANMLRGKNRPN